MQGGHVSTCLLAPTDGGCAALVDPPRSLIWPDGMPQWGSTVGRREVGTAHARLLNQVKAFLVLPGSSHSAP
jgi:hypothetical protein